MCEHVTDANVGLGTSAETLGSRNISLGFFAPPPLFSLAHWMSPLTPAATTSVSPGCTVYSGTGANMIFFLGGICRTWDVCIYKYIIYINIYNTDLKLNFPDIHFF